MEKYFWVVFDKLKKIDLGFSGVSGVSAVFCPECVHGKLTVATVKRGVIQIWYPRRELVYYDVCHNKCEGETPGSRNRRNTRNPRKSEGRFLFIYQKRPQNIATINHGKSRTWFSKQVMTYYEVLNNKCTHRGSRNRRNTRYRGSTDENPRLMFFNLPKTTRKYFSIENRTPVFERYIIKA